MPLVVLVSYFSTNFFRHLPIFRYGRVQSVKIFISPGTARTTTIVPTSQFSPSGGIITSTTEISLTGGKHQGIEGADDQQDQNNLSSTISSKFNNSHQPTATSAGATKFGSTQNLLEPIGVNSFSVSNNNVTSSNQNCITMCAATIAFVDIKSASKAHLAEHKFEDRLLTTEYYEPSTMLHGSSMDGGEGSTLVGVEKDERSVSRNQDQQQRFSTSNTTNHGHGLVWQLRNDTFIVDGICRFGFI